MNFFLVVMNVSWLLLRSTAAAFVPRTTTPAVLHRQQRLSIIVRPNVAMAANTINTNSYSPPLTPRAAVSCVVRCAAPEVCYYLLVQRGTEPNKGLWSLPGGKLELGETTLEGAKRELVEETTLAGASWCAEPFSVTDAIHLDGAVVAFHYVIAQCFAQVQMIPDGTGTPPTVVAADDAANAEWHTMEQVRWRVDNKESTIGILKVLERAECLYQAGMLPVE
jgi:8-oxo-dGTP diphosphatase